MPAKPRSAVYKQSAAKVFNVHEAKTQLSRLLARVERGESITIARAGSPIAVISPSPSARRKPLPPDDPLLNIRKFAVDGPGGKFTNEDIDRILYGGS